MPLLDQLVFETVAQPIGLRTDDPDHMNRYYHSQGATRWMGLSDKTVDDLFAKQASAMDVEVRKKLVRELEERLFELTPNAPLYWALWADGAWPEMRDYKPGISVYNNNKYEHVWLGK